MQLLYNCAPYIYNIYMLCALDRNYIIENDIIKKISKFFYSDYYFIALFVVTTLFWGIGQMIPGIAIVVGISTMLFEIAAIVVIQRDVLPIVPLIFFTMFCLSSPSVPSYMWIVTIPAILVVGAALFHFFYYRIEEFKFGKLFFPMGLFFIAILLGGIGAKLPASKTGTLMGALLIVIGPLFVYLIMLNYGGKNIEMRRYIAKTMMYFGFTMVVHLISFYVFKPVGLVAIEGVPHLGYGISNTIATYFLITFPMCFYLYVTTGDKKSYVYLLVGLLQFISIILTTSRGATIFGVVEFFVTAIVTIFVLDKKKRKGYLLFTAIVLAVGAVMFVLLYNKVIGFIKYMFSDGMNDSGRFELYREALACITEYPVFGAGLGYIGKWDKVFNSIGIYMFHNTILQYLACLGIVGLIAYAYIYFVRLEILFEHWDTYSLYILMIFIGFEGYSLLNTGTIQGYPTAIILAVLYVAHEIETKQKEPRIYGDILKKLKVKRIIKERV